jgi:hypothetical protein
LSANSDARAEPERPPARCYCVVMTAEPALAWLPAGAGALQLPHVEVNNPNGYTGLAEAIQRALLAELGIWSELLCHLADQWPPAPAAETMVAVVQARPDSLPAGWQGLMAEEVAAREFAEPRHGELIGAWLRSNAPGAVPVKRAAWARPGWRAGAEAWIRAQLAALGLAPTGRMTLVKVWSISFVLRVPTEAGDFYFKAVPPLFGREPALTEALARRHPGRVPEVVAINRREGWLLMRGFQGPLLAGSEDLGEWQAALRAYARVQMAWCDALDTLRAAGCPERGPAQLAEQVDELLADEALLLVGQPHGLTAEQAGELRTLAPRLKAACRAWAEAGVPLALEHGDFHAQNVAVLEEQFVIFDWTDGCIAHPFVCLTALLELARPAWHAALTAAYLEPWRARATETQIETAARLARVLGPLHMARSYYEIQHAAEPLMLWQLEAGAPYFLKQVLAARDALEA